MLLAAIVGLGALRERYLTPALGDLLAHQVGTLWACAAALAVGFEIGFFHFVTGRPWSVLLADYNLLKGRLLLWLSVLLGPYVVARLDHR